MSKIKSLNIAYWFGYINKDLTDTMIERLDILLRSCKSDSAHPYTMGISQFDAVDPTKLLQALEDTVSQSISTMERSVNSIDMCEIPYTIQEEPPKFTSADSTDIEQSSVLSYSEPESTLLEYVIEKLQDVTLSFLKPSSLKRLQKAKQPFSAGAQRIAYHAKDCDDGERYVVKESKYKKSVEQKRDEYLTTVKIYGVADLYAKHFNKEKPSYANEIHFIEVKFYEHPENVDGRVVLMPYLYEKYMEGKYSKYNTNGGWVTSIADEYSATLQAFSHYSWVKSNKKLVVCDLQGVTKSNKIYLTDPAVHCIDYMILQYKKGGNNLGLPGIQKFFRTHICNRVCHQMKLEPFR